MNGANRPETLPNSLAYPLANPAFVRSPARAGESPGTPGSLHPPPRGRDAAGHPADPARRRSGRDLPGGKLRQPQAWLRRGAPPRCQRQPGGGDRLREKPPRLARPRAAGLGMSPGEEWLPGTAASPARAPPPPPRSRPCPCVFPLAPHSPHGGHEAGGSGERLGGGPVRRGDGPRDAAPGDPPTRATPRGVLHTQAPTQTLLRGLPGPRAVLCVAHRTPMRAVPVGCGAPPVPRA